MSTQTPSPPPPSARRAAEVARQADALIRRLHALGIDPGPTTADAAHLESAHEALDRGLEAVLDQLGTAPPNRRATLAPLVVELHDARRSIRALRMGGRGRPADTIDQGVTRLRNVPSTTGLLDRVCGEAVACCGLSRVALSTVAEREWSVCRIVVEGEPDASVPPELLAMSPEDAGPERDVLRSGRPVLVEDPAAGGSGATTPMSALFAGSHVVVPIPSSSGVLGLLHGDHHPTDRRADEVDRDLLAALAHSFGQIYERAALQERLERQRRALISALEAESTAADELGRADFALPGSGVDGAALPVLPGPPGGNPAIDALLTPREHEVLELILAGASNGAIAERLVITTGTVKSHVKRVLRKIGAANRSEAISRYLDLGAGRP